MGQQQLLLLVLGIVIVGLAVVVGIRAFSENQSKSVQDAMNKDAVQFLADGRAWGAKPQSIGGGNGTPFDELDLGDFGYDVDLDGVYTNSNARYRLTPNNGDLLITGCSPGIGLTMSMLVTRAFSDGEAIQTGWVDDPGCVAFGA